jgi:glutamate/tyrosine decarboxylase-like PLP-dependent enzyme
MLDFPMKELLNETAERAARYLRSLPARSVTPSPESIAALHRLGGPLPETPTDPAEVLALLDNIGSPATVATAGPRYFGFVTGGTLPAALAAGWLAGAWDQNGAMQIMSPVAARLEEIVLQWIIDLLNLPAGSGAGFVTGTTMANFSSLAAARTTLLARAGWNVEEDGLFGAPPIHVVVGDEVHVSLLKALSLLGFGRSRVTRVPVDGQGRILPWTTVRFFVYRQATLTPVRSIPPGRFAPEPAMPAAGFTSTAPSACGRPCLPTMPLC